MDSSDDDALCHGSTTVVFLIHNSVVIGLLL